MEWFLIVWLIGLLFGLGNGSANALAQDVGYGMSLLTIVLWPISLCILVAMMIKWEINQWRKQ